MKLESSRPPPEADLLALREVIAVVARLRAPGGCPWDAEQSLQSLRPYLIEEAFEVLDLLDQIDSTATLVRRPDLRQGLQEELGDLLMQILLQSEITREAGLFGIAEVASALQAKLIRRHPHVFGDAQGQTLTEASGADARTRWEREKLREKKTKVRSSVLHGLPRQLPALQRWGRVLEKVLHVGYPSTPPEELTSRVLHEAHHLEILARQGAAAHSDQWRSSLGRMLLHLGELAHPAGVELEATLRAETAGYERRFCYVEARVRALNLTWDAMTPAELATLVAEAQRVQNIAFWGLTGGLGAGKSAAGQILQDLGFTVIDADAITHEILDDANHPLIPTLIARFGTRDRQALRQLLTEDEVARADLEAILHPAIWAEVQHRALLADQRVAIVEASLLVETGRSAELRGLIVLDASEAHRIRRVHRRNPDWTQAQISAILARQTSSAQRNAQATVVWMNEGSIEELRRQILDWLQSGALS